MTTNKLNPLDWCLADSNAETSVEMYQSDQSTVIIDCRTTPPTYRGYNESDLLYCGPSADDCREELEMDPLDFVGLMSSDVIYLEPPQS